MTTPTPPLTKRPLTDCQLLRHWVEIELRDEAGNPIENMPYFLDGPRGQKRWGRSDAAGLIREEDLAAIPAYIMFGAQALADEMQTRPLRAQRGEAGSTVKAGALAAGHRYHYLRIGQLCDGRPRIPNWQEAQLPAYHFPEEPGEGLRLYPMSQRHVVEVCPFRAWVPCLTHSKAYNLVNAYNLALMAILAYADKEKNETLISRGSVQDFFFRQLLDLDQLPNKVNGQYFPLAAKDVPFSGRYYQLEFIDTAEDEDSGNDTQMFYAVNPTEAIVAWRGTVSGKDMLTDANGLPVKAEDIANLPGNAHNGFKTAFTASNLHDRESANYATFKTALAGKKTYLCGHSLGGALALLHSAYIKGYMKSLDIVLYSYGMPRTFSRSITERLDFAHYRHVNNRDTVPAVPSLSLGRTDIKEWMHTALETAFPQLVLANGRYKGPADYAHHGHLVHFKTLTYSLPINAVLPDEEFKLLLPISLTGEGANEALQKDLLGTYHQERAADNPMTSQYNGFDHSSAQYAAYLYQRLTALMVEKRQAGQHPFIQQRDKADAHQRIYPHYVSWGSLLAWDKNLLNYHPSLLGADGDYQQTELHMMGAYQAPDKTEQAKRNAKQDLADSERALAAYQEEYAQEYQKTEKRTETISMDDQTYTAEIPVGKGTEKLRAINKNIFALRNNIRNLMETL